MKSYTDLKQSKKLAEILPLESADMRYHTISHHNSYPCDEIVYTVDFSKPVDIDIPCWSLAALISVLPGTITSNDGIAFELNIKKNIIEYSNPSLYLVYKSVKSNNLIDGCYEMVVWLKENGKL